MPREVLLDPPLDVGQEEHRAVMTGGQHDALGAVCRLPQPRTGFERDDRVESPLDQQRGRRVEARRVAERIDSVERAVCLAANAIGVVAARSEPLEKRLHLDLVARTVEHVGEITAGEHQRCSVDARVVGGDQVADHRAHADAEQPHTLEAHRLVGERRVGGEEIERATHVDNGVADAPRRQLEITVGIEDVGLAIEAQRCQADAGEATREPIRLRIVAAQDRQHHHQRVASRAWVTQHRVHRRVLGILAIECVVTEMPRGEFGLLVGRGFQHERKLDRGVAERIGAARPPAVLRLRRSRSHGAARTRQQQHPRSDPRSAALMAHRSTPPPVPRPTSSR